MSNVLAAIDKFLCDSLVMEGKIEDDNRQYMQNKQYIF